MEFELFEKTFHIKYSTLLGFLLAYSVLKTSAFGL